MRLPPFFLRGRFFIDKDGLCANVVLNALQINICCLWQDREVVSHLAHTQEIDGAIPSPATNIVAGCYFCLWLPF